MSAGEDVPQVGRAVRVDARHVGVPPRLPRSVADAPRELPRRLFVGHVGLHPVVPGLAALQIAPHLVQGQGGLGNEKHFGLRRRKPTWRGAVSPVPSSRILTHTAPPPTPSEGDGRPGWAFEASRGQKSSGRSTSVTCVTILPPPYSTLKATQGSRVGKGVRAMSGPALRQPAAHHAIHQAAWQDAEEALELAAAMLAASRGDEFARMVEIFLEVVATRILAHAQEEEAGLYREWRAEHAGWGGEVDALIREHDTLRELAAAVEQAMRGHDAVGAMSAMHRLLQASDLHARHEEEVLHRLAVRGARPPGERAAARGASREL